VGRKIIEDDVEEQAEREFFFTRWLLQVFVDFTKGSTNCVEAR